MFGLGGTELLLVLLIAVIFIGPKELPKIATQLGRFYRQFKDAAENLKSTVEKEIQEPATTPPHKTDPDVGSTVGSTSVDQFPV